MNRPIHFEIVTENPESVAEFYKQAFDWDINTWDGPQSYWLVTTGDSAKPGINGAIMGKHFDQRVINTLEVESFSDAQNKIESAGGKLVNGPNEIPDIGTHGYFADTDGNMFGVLEPAS